MIKPKMREREEYISYMTLDKIVARAQELIGEHPSLMSLEDFTIRIAFDYGDDTHISIVYITPETPEEIRDRKSVETRNEEILHRRYLELKAKFENKL